MSDARELILARMREVAEVVLIDSFEADYAPRNMLEISETRLPAVTILEGDEESAPSQIGKDRPATAPVKMSMTPEVCIVASESPDDLGTKLNAIRKALIDAFATDSDLISILGTNGSIAYRGMISDLGLGRAMLGRMALRFAITYFVLPGR